jgi:hypothetical protein
VCVWIYTEILLYFQAIDWIEELCDVMLRNHTDMGTSVQEADALQEDNRKFEATAAVSLHVTCNTF